MKATIQTVLQAYKRWLSPALTSSCRYVPSCSEYAMEAVERHGALNGLILTAWRILRCHPFAGGGFDPVPESLIGSRQTLSQVTAAPSKTSSARRLKAGPSLAR